MNSLWSKLYEATKDRRYGTLFLGTFLGLLGLFAASLLFGAWIGWGNYIKPFLLAAGVLILAISWRLIRHARQPNRNRLKLAGLSRDELAKARSKLMKDRSLRKS